MRAAQSQKSLVPSISGRFRAAAGARWLRGPDRAGAPVEGDYRTGYAFLVISAVATLIALVVPRVNFSASVSA